MEALVLYRNSFCQTLNELYFHLDKSDYLRKEEKKKTNCNNLIKYPRYT